MVNWRFVESFTGNGVCERKLLENTVPSIEKVIGTIGVWLRHAAQMDHYTVPSFYEMENESPFY